MTNFLVAIAVLILVAALVSIIRVVRGPTLADKLIVLQLVGTAGVAILLVLGKALDDRSLIDTGLVIALLASVTATAFAGRRRARRTARQDMS